MSDLICRSQTKMERRHSWYRRTLRATKKGPLPSLPRLLPSANFFQTLFLNYTYKAIQIMIRNITYETNNSQLPKQNVIIIINDTKKCVCHRVLQQSNTNGSVLGYNIHSWNNCWYDHIWAERKRAGNLFLPDSIAVDELRKPSDIQPVFYSKSRANKKGKTFFFSFLVP